MDKNRSMIVKQTEYELREHGYALSKEDVDDLIKTQEFAYKACKMIDFSHDIVFELATVFVQSPYIQPTTYVPLLKNLLYAYYKVRKSVSGYSDKELVLFMYRGYLKQKGIVDHKYVAFCVRLGKQEWLQL